MDAESSFHSDITAFAVMSAVGGDLSNVAVASAARPLELVEEHISVETLCISLCITLWKTLGKRRGEDGR